MKYTSYKLCMLIQISFLLSASGQQTWSPASGYNTSIELAQTGWGAHHGILFNARLRNPLNDGSMLDNGNLQNVYAEGPYGSGAGAILFLANGGRMDFMVGAASGGVDSNVSWGVPKLSIARTGNIGIGTYDATHKLTINAPISAGNPQISIFNPDNASDAVSGIRFHTASGWNVMLRTRQDVAWLELTDAGGGVAHTWNSGNYFATGKIAVGTTDMPGNHRLYVNGSAIATEIVVKLKDNWPDYVFEPTYNLPSISELEQYLKTNKHLPEVPTANEVKEKGLSLGEMNAILLKKVEELTLHLIEQHKNYQLQQAEIDKLKEENRSLQTKVDNILKN